MPELRPSLLLRQPRRALSAAALVASQSLFLWMFLAADPLEQLAASGAFDSDQHTSARAVAFAAAWRHGMSGNSPLYMPGFFAVAVAAWLWCNSLRRRQICGYLTALAVALALACAAAPVGTRHVLAAFHAATGLAPVEAAPFASAQAMASGVYTLLTWTAFVVGSRLALEERTIAPLLPVPVLTAGLIVLRPWTVDEFTRTWWIRSLAGDPVAIVSALLVPAVAVVLAVARRRRESAIN